LLPSTKKTHVHPAFGGKTDEELFNGLLGRKNTVEVLKKT
jgi:hypothetical protein